MLIASLNKTFPSFLPSHEETGDKLISRDVLTFKSCQFLLHTLNSLSQGRSKWVNRVDNVQGPRRRKEGNVLFNDALNTLYLRLYGVGHMVKDHSDSERGNPLPPHGLLFPINSNGFLYAPSHRQDSTNHGLCYTSHGALAGTRNRSDDPSHYEHYLRGPRDPNQSDTIGLRGPSLFLVHGHPEGRLLRQCSFPAILSEMEVGNDVCASRFYYSLKLFKL